MHSLAVLWLITRFNSGERRMSINPFESHDIGIELYSLNVVRNPQVLNLSYVEMRMKNKESTRYAIAFTDQLPLHSVNQQLVQIFSEFWERRVLNVIIIFWTNRLNCFTYSPFGETFLMPVSVNETRAERLFVEKSNNLLGHTIRVGMFYEPQRAIIWGQQMKGIDGEFAQMVIKSMNATLQLIEPTDDGLLGEMFANGSSNGIFALLQNHTVDMSFNARFFRMHSFRGAIEPTLTIGRDDLCIMVPRSGYSLNLDNIFDSFEWIVWILIIIALPIYAIFFHVYHRRCGCSRRVHSISHIFLRLFGWNVNQPYMRSPKTPFAKLMIALWIVYSAVITNWYNSNLTSFLMVKSRLPDITTIHQLEQSNYHILTIQRYVDMLNEFLINSKEHQSLMGRIHATDYADLYSRTVQSDTSYAYAHKEHLIRYILRKGHLFDRFVQMQECPVPFINVYALSYGSPYKGRVNWILSQAQDCGLIDHWMEIGLHRDNINQARSLKSACEQGISISISHLQSAFYILLFGCIVSFLVFLFEINRKSGHCATDFDAHI